MNTLLINATIGIKRVVEEDGTPEALAILRKAKSNRPELLVVECANILLKENPKT